jgi:membrane protein YqaA with SNARE-associated domain
VEHSLFSIGTICAISGAFLPLFNEVLIIVSIALLIAAFVLAILAMTRGKIVGGILLLIGVAFAFPASCVYSVSRDEIIHRSRR